MRARNPTDKLAREIDRLRRQVQSRGPQLPHSSVPGSVTNITQILTNPAGVLGFVNTDTATVTEPGDITINLTYKPIPGSVHVYWGRLPLVATDWTLIDQTIMILDPEFELRAGQKIFVVYAYDPTVAVVAPPVPGGGILVPFQASGWKWKQVIRTDATDYSATGYDDSAWAIAPAAFGDGGDMADDAPIHTTLWQKTTRMWARRILTGVAPGQEIVGIVRVDRDITIWMNGTQVWSGIPNGNEQTFTIPGASVPGGSVVLACRITDESHSLGCYFDLELTQ